ncbi:MAG: cupin domain-containing protein [Patescibacteria group bacterium]|nr:cupin domain-containing protein [Patescibacteria group bacterium]
MKQKIDNDNWIKGESYRKRILIKKLEDKINIIEDIVISPKGEIPCHSHNSTDEIFYITDNSATMIVNDKKFKVNPNDMIYVNKKENHGFKNNSNKEFKMIVFKINFKKEDSFLKQMKSNKKLN